MKVGTQVQSRFRARWFGVVERVDIAYTPWLSKKDRKTEIALVKVLYDRRGNKLWKPQYHRLNVFWLEKINFDEYGLEVYE